jgi:hypothetical protein
MLLLDINLCNMLLAYCCCHTKLLVSGDWCVHVSVCLVIWSVLCRDQKVRVHVMWVNSLVLIFCYNCYFIMWCHAMDLKTSGSIHTILSRGGDPTGKIRSGDRDGEISPPLRACSVTPIQKGIKFSPSQKWLEGDLNPYNPLLDWCNQTSPEFDRDEDGDG